MSSEFVRYAPEIEIIDPNLDELLAQIIDFVEKKGRESPRTEGTGRAVRAARAKSFGLGKAAVEILADVPAPYAQGIYATLSRRGALIRFSSTSGHLGTDAQLGPGLGFVRALTQIQVGNPLLVTYWTMGAVRHGDHAAKIRVAPSAENARQAIHRELDLTSGPDVFCPALTDELQARAFDFDLQVQLCTDLAARPVNDVTVDWPEKLSPFVTVGRVHLPRQDLSGPENLEKSDALAFNQWRVTSDHRSLGEIMSVRRIYSASAKVRRTLNHQPQTEPISADAVLP